ncbi:MAG: hypothetical protein ACM3UM_00025 [Nitrososphaerales archaeon]
MRKEVNRLRRNLLALGGLALLGLQARDDGIVRPSEAQTKPTFNVFDYLTPTQVADVKAYTYRFDVAPAIERAFATAKAAGGGTVIAPAGGYLLGTSSKDPNGIYSYITARDGVSFMGEGMNRTVLKVKAGEIARFNGTNGPTIIGTQQATPLRDCSFSYFSVDWDGPNNLLKSTDTPRNSASIISVNGGINITCTEVRSISTPGNQCIFFPAFKEQGQGNIKLIRCEAYNCGSGLVGNYNTDHSSFYCNGTGLVYDNLRGDAQQMVVGALFELHGSEAQAIGCRSNNYSLGFWIASNYQPIKNIKVSNARHTMARSAFSLSAEKYAVDNVEIATSEFQQAPGLGSAGPSYFVNGNTIAACNLLYVHDCTFRGQSYSFMRFLQLFKIANFRFETNTVNSFATYGILGTGLDIGGGRFISQLIVLNNTFNDVTNAIYANVPTLSADKINIQGNTFNRTARDYAPAITITAKYSTGNIGPNSYSPNYVTSVSGQPNGAAIAG